MNLPRPMKAKDISKEWTGTTPRHEGLVLEPKVDGVRAYLLAEGGKTRLIIATSHTEISHPLPQMDGLEDHFSSLLLDGELVIPGERLGPLVGALNASSRRSILDHAVFYAFDVLHFEAKPTRGRFITTSQPLHERRKMLESLEDLFPRGVRLMSQYDVNDGIVDAIKGAGFEGFMLKDNNSLYNEGRSSTWMKVKWVSTIDCFVTGWEAGKGGYKGLVGSLKMSVLDDNGRPVEIGKHGVFTERMRVEMTAPDGTLKPDWEGQVMELTYQAVGTDLRLRHPRLLRLRPDKQPTDCRMDQLGVSHA